jgi:AAA domain
MAFKPALKKNAKLRFAISGPSGSGKTFTLLRLATELAAGGKIAYVDTEHGSASKYAHTPACTVKCDDPSHFTFDVIEPSTFDPRDLMDNLADAKKEGYAVFVADSLSHYWMGPDGELELVDNAAKSSRSGNSFAAWKTVTPIHNKLVDAILAAPLHVLVSMRTKTEWVIEKDEKGKSVPRKIGLAPIMRDGIEFEFDVCGDIDQDNTLTITKTRCSALNGKSFNRPGPDIADTLKAWLGSPEAAQPETRDDGLAPQQQTAVQSSTHHEASPAQPAADQTPGPLQALFENLGKPGYVKQAYELMKRRLIELSPDGGDAEYKRIIEQHSARDTKDLAVHKITLLDMWQVADEWARQKTALGVTDDDVPKAGEPATQGSLLS